MKHSFKIFSLLFILLSWIIVGLMVIFMIQATHFNELSVCNFEETDPIIIESIDERKEITFILGEDADPNNPYYAQAENYYRSHPTEKQEWIVNHCRSLVEVRDYLADQNDGEPWKKVNLVVHSNKWMGMGLPITRDGKRTTIPSLKYAIESDQLSSLPDSIVDDQTEIVIYGCGLGNNEPLLTAIGEALGGNDYKSPVVRSSNYFIAYLPYEGYTEKYLTESYFAFYKTGYRPGDIKLSNSLKKNYPEQKIDFRDALSRKQPRFPGDPYHYYFNIPVNWTVAFSNESEVPELSSKELESAFLNEQFELVSAINKMKIPLDKFRWQFKKITYTFDDGTTEPAIQIKGKTSVLCVLHPLTREDSNKPLVPENNDTKYFTSVGNKIEHTPILSALSNQP